MKTLLIKQGDTFIYPATLSSLVYGENNDSNLLELSTNDGTLNNTILNEALALGDVKLKKGNYPVEPGVVVNNVTLDLNGACLTCSQRKNIGLIHMKGEKPVIRNGELCGTFNEFLETDYEAEGLIRCFLYGDALIENVELHNCYGYAICQGYPDWDGGEAKRVAVATATEVTGNVEPLGTLTESRQFFSGYINITGDYKYLCIYDSGTDNRVLSVRNVIFRFYDSNNTFISAVEEMPRVMVAIPQSAAKVRVVTYRYTNYNPNVYLGFFNTEVKCITVQNCCIHNNYRLGVLGMPYGTMKVINCRSYGHGKPQKDSTKINTNTVAFFNAEDNCTAKVIIENCTSEDENNLALLGAYKATVSNCTGNITVYRGWHANISNCVGVVETFSDSVTTMVNVSNCVITGNHHISTNWIGSNNTFIDCNICDITKEDNFIVRKEHRTTGTTGFGQTPPITGLVRGKIYNAHVTSGNAGIRQVATAPGSNFIYEWNNASNASDISHGTVPVSGDCYGITANCPFYPNGKKIYNSTFTPVHNFGATIINNSTTLNNYWTGEYVNCNFNIVTGAMFNCDSTKYGVSGSNRTLIFRNCTINIAVADADKTQYYLFRNGLVNATEKNYTVKFINCNISDDTLLFHPDAAGISYEIVTEDTNYDARIKALEDALVRT